MHIKINAVSQPFYSHRENYSLNASDCHQPCLWIEGGLPIACLILKDIVLVFFFLLIHSELWESMLLNYSRSRLRKGAQKVCFHNHTNLYLQIWPVSTITIFFFFPPLANSGIWFGTNPRKARIELLSGLPQSPTTSTEELIEIEQNLRP